jgi:deoxyribonuclease V
LVSSRLYIDTKKHQEEIAREVITTDRNALKIKYVCGIDVSYRNNLGYCCAAIIDKDSLKAIEYAYTISVIDHPYVPGLFVLREFEPIMRTLKLLKTQFHILLIDGHGRLHPRRCGLASYIGVKIDKPTIGVAKSLLCGFVRQDQFVEFGRDILGFRITNIHKKQIYVSIGHKVSLGSAINIVKQLTKTGQWIPEPLRIADINSKKLRQVCMM